MADKKETRLSIVIRTVDQATAKINAISARLDKVTKPIRDFRQSLSDLREKSGLDDVIGGFKGVGSAIAGVLAKVAVIGGVVAAATAGLFKLIDGFDELGDKAEAMGVSVDFLAQMRYAAERAGASVQELDQGMEAFSRSLGQARAGTGRMASFLNKVSPALLRQLKAAKSNEEAFDLLAGAMAKLEDPAKRAALAQATLNDPALGPLFAKGPKAIKALRDRYLELAGSQEGAAEEAGKVDDAMKDLKAATDGVKAALVAGLAPALKVIVDRLRVFFTENRERIAEWAKGLGERVPAAVGKLVDVFKGVVNTVRPFVDSTTKLKVVAVALAGVIAGPLISSLVSLGIAIATTPVGWILAALAAIGVAAAALIFDWGGVRSFFVDLWDALAEKFGWAAHVIKLVLLPITGLATFFIGAWEPVSEFFVRLWDNVTGVFADAWEFIAGIVGKIVEAVDYVTNKVKEFVSGTEEGRANMLDAFGGGGLTPEQRAAFIKGSVGGTSSSEAKVTVDFANAPRGTSVRADPKSTADVDLSVGYQLTPGVP